MKITSVKIRLKRRHNEKLKAYVSIVFDDEFIVNDIKLINGRNGLFIAMPAEKRQRRCPNCHKKVDVRSNFCNYCGTKLDMEVPRAEELDGKDLAHPLTRDFREYLNKAVIDEYNIVKEQIADNEFDPVGAGSDAVMTEDTVPADTAAPDLE